MSRTELSYVVLQKGVQVNARSCKHLKSLLGDKYEENRVSKAKWLADKDKPDSKATSSSTATKKRKKADSDDDDDAEDEEAEELSEDEDAPKSKSKGKGKAPAKKPKLAPAAEEDSVTEDESEDEDVAMPDVAQDVSDEDVAKLSDDNDDGVAGDAHGQPGSSAGDELAEINGIKPEVYLADGVEKEVKSMSRYIRNLFAASCMR